MSIWPRQEAHDKHIHGKEGMSQWASHLHKALKNDYEGYGGRLAVRYSEY